MSGDVNLQEEPVIFYSEEMTMAKMVVLKQKAPFLHSISISPSNRELQSSSGAPGNGLLLRLPGIFSSFSSSHDELVWVRFMSEEMQRVSFVYLTQTVQSTVPLVQFE